MYMYVSTRKCWSVSFLHVTTRKLLWPVCNGWPLIGRLTCPPDDASSSTGFISRAVRYS